MTLLDALLPEPVRPETVATQGRPKKRRRHQRPERRTQAALKAQEQRLADELRAKRQEQAARMQQEQAALIEASAVLPDGIRIVEGQEVGQMPQVHDGADR